MLVRLVSHVLQGRGEKGRSGAILASERVQLQLWQNKLFRVGQQDPLQLSTPFALYFLSELLFSAISIVSAILCRLTTRNHPTYSPHVRNMEAVKDTINSALEKLHLTGGAAQGTPAKEPSEQELNELKSKYEKAGQEQVFVSPTML